MDSLKGKRSVMRNDGRKSEIAARNFLQPPKPSNSNTIARSIKPPHRNEPIFQTAPVVTKSKHDPVRVVSKESAADKIEEYKNTLQRSNFYFDNVEFPGLESLVYKCKQLGCVIAFNSRLFLITSIWK
jgi:hypothetical protein